nr:hypothetical protein [Tanacetum cinerariifolium]
DKIFNDFQSSLQRFSSSDDESSHEEVIHEMSFKTYSNPLFDLDEEFISSEFNPIHNEDLDSTPKNDRFDTDSYLLESSLNRDTLMISSFKIDSLLAEFAGELIFLESIPSGVDEANCDPEEDIHLFERLLYDNSSPRLPEEYVSENSNANIESFFPSSIPNEDSDSSMEEINLFLTPNDPMPPSIEDDDDDSERDILILEELIDNYSLSLTENESFRFDIPSFSRIPDTMCVVHLVNNPTPLEAKDHFEIVINSNDDISPSDDNSLYNENIEYVEASPHDSKVVNLEVAEIVIPEAEEIEDDNLREKLLNVHLLIANIQALKDNPTPSFEFLTKSSSTSLKSFLEETNTFYNSLPEFENFCFDLEEISSGSTTTHSDISLPDYEAFYFYDDHIKEISSGSTTTHSNIPLSEYDSFIFDLLNDQFPPTDRSDFTHEEFSDEFAHIISPSEYDFFYFRNLPDPGELISILNSRIRENLSSTTRVNLPVEDDHSPLLTYVVWIFLAYLTYLIIPPYLHSFRNEDTIFDRGITINRFCSFKPGLSHRCGTFKKFNTHRSHLNESPMEMLSSTYSPMDQ